MFTHVYPSDHYPTINTTNHNGMRFYDTPDGKFPSITTVLGVKEKPWLTQWKLSMGDKKAKQEQQRCAERGEAVHQLVEAYIKNEDVEQLTKNTPQEYIKLFRQLKQGLSKHVTNIYAQEVALWDTDLKVAGRVDLIADWDGVPSIIDFKTSTTMKREDQIEDYFLQAAAYALMYERQYGIMIDQVVILMTTERGFLPLKFKRDVDVCIEPLIKRIGEFFELKGHVVTQVNKQ